MDSSRSWPWTRRTASSRPGTCARAGVAAHLRQGHDRRGRRRGRARRGRGGGQQPRLVHRPRGLRRAVLRGRIPPRPGDVDAPGGALAARANAIIYPVCDDDWLPSPRAPRRRGGVRASSSGESHALHPPRRVRRCWPGGGGREPPAQGAAPGAHGERDLPDPARPARSLPHGPGALRVRRSARALRGPRVRAAADDPDRRPGRTFSPWSTDLDALRDYTLGHQVTEPYDFTASVRVALREFAPDHLVLPGPWRAPRRHRRAGDGRGTLGDRVEGGLPGRHRRRASPSSSAWACRPAERAAPRSRLLSPRGAGPPRRSGRRRRRRAPPRGSRPRCDRPARRPCR